VVLGRGRGSGNGGDLARAIAPVIAKPVDIEPVVRRRRVDLELDHLALVHADVGGETLDVWVSVTNHVPLALRIPELLVLADDRVCGAGGSAGRGERPGGVGGERIA